MVLQIETLCKSTHRVPGSKKAVQLWCHAMLQSSIPDACLALGDTQSVRQSVSQSISPQSIPLISQSAKLLMSPAEVCSLLLAQRYHMPHKQHRCLGTAAQLLSLLLGTAE